MSKIDKMNLNSNNIPTPMALALAMAGSEFTAELIDTVVTAGTSIYAVVTNPPTKYVIFNFRELQMDQERGFYRAFTVFTGGAKIGDVNIQKVRPDSPIPADATMELWSTPDSIDQASRIVEIPLFGAAGQGNSPTQGDLADDQSVRILPPGAKFLVEFENASVADAYFRLEFKWFEVSPGFVIDATGV
jgi:hypothetical protein